MDEPALAERSAQHPLGIETAPLPAREPTARDLECLDAILAYKRAHDGCAPTVRQLMRLWGLHSTHTAHYRLERLERAGLITRGAGSCQIKVRGGHWSLAPNRETHMNAPAESESGDALRTAG